MRTRPGWVEPEVYFRIVHVAHVGLQGAPMAPYREQTVETALGPKDAFENGNIGTLRLRAPPSRVVSTTPPDKSAKVPKIPRIVELLRKALEWKSLLESGKIASQAEIARREGITRARVTQVMGLLRLAPQIHQGILATPATIRRQGISERALRHITRIEDRGRQAELFTASMSGDTTNTETRNANITKRGEFHP